jgi:hypothetical protein
MNTLSTVALELAFASEYDLAWGDWGSKANSNFSSWRPRVPNGFSKLGDYAKKEYGAPETAMIVVKANQANALAHPVDYKLIWGDWGSGAKGDGSFWEPVPPNGYKALGLVVGNGHSKPPLNSVVCVRNDLVVRATVGDLIWGDWGSGAKGNVTLYQTSALTAPADSKLAYITPGSFCGHNSYNSLASSTVAYALAVELPTEVKIHSSDDLDKKLPFPVLTGVREPADTAMVLESVTYLPCTMVKDPAYKTDVKRQVAETPFYRLEKHTFYKRHTFHTNSEGVQGEMSFAYTHGMSKADTEEITNTIGVALTAGYGGGNAPGPSVSMTVSYSFSLTQSTTTTVSVETTDTVKYHVPKNGAVAVYTRSYRYRLMRADGSEVRSWVASSKGSHFASYPPQKGDGIKA